VSVIVIYILAESTNQHCSKSDEFYLELQEPLDRAPGKNLIFLLGHFNDQGDKNMDRWYPSLGKFGVGKEFNNGYRML